MSFGSWPYMRGQCPHCRYFHAYAPVQVDDKGYTLLGFCRHPRIGMELFTSPNRSELSEGTCPVFWRKP